MPTGTWLFAAVLTALQFSFIWPVPCMMLLPDGTTMMTDICMLCSVCCAVRGVLRVLFVATYPLALWFWSTPLPDIPLLLQSNELCASVAVLLVPARGLPWGRLDPSWTPGVGAGAGGGWL